MFLTNIGEKPKFARRGLSSITARGFSSVPPIKQNENSFYIKPCLRIIFAGTLPLVCIFFLSIILSFDPADRSHLPKLQSARFPEVPALVLDRKNRPALVIYSDAGLQKRAHPILQNLPSRPNLNSPILQEDRGDACKDAYGFLFDHDRKF